MLTRYRLFLAVVTLAGTGILMLSTCGGASSATDWFFGDSLAIRVKEMRLVKEVRYTDEQGTHYLIRPSQEARSLAAARLEIRNRESNMVYLAVGKNNVRLRDDKFLDYRPIDPLQDRQEVAETGSAQNTLVPFIWGNTELPTTCGENNLPCELTGWMLFEVPPDIKFYQLIWEVTDTVYLRFGAVR